MSDFKIFDLQSNAINHIKRDYWNAVMISAIIYGISLAAGAVTSAITTPLQLFSGVFTSFSLHGILTGFQSLPNIFGSLSIMLLPLVLVAFLPLLAEAAMEPANAGSKLAYLDIAAGKKAEAETIFTPFKRFWRFVGAFFWQALFTFLWSLLFVIPGIIKSLAYFAMPYLVAEYPGLPVQEAMKISMRITMGYKHKIFFMYLLLFLWGLIAIPAAAITCGIGAIAYSVLWLAPLTAMMSALIYNKIKMLAFEEGRITAKDLHITSPGQ